MGPVGLQEMSFIFLLALLLFGPKKLPELGRMLGKAMTEFRRAQSELKATFDREMQNLERENRITEGNHQRLPVRYITITIILHSDSGTYAILRSSTTESHGFHRNQHFHSQRIRN